MGFTLGNDKNILQGTDLLYVGAGLGNDKYILAANKLSAGQIINITDTDGANTLQLIGGLTITKSVFYADFAELTLSNGAVVKILGASTFTYELGGDPLTSTPGVITTYGGFAITLGSSVPETGMNESTGGTVNTDGTVSTSTTGQVDPVFSTDFYSFSVPEDRVQGYAVGQVVATDLNTTDTLTYSITSGNTLGYFAVDASTGSVSLTAAANGNLNYEGQKTYTLDVLVLDGKGGQDTAQVTVNVSNVNEAPVFQDSTPFEFEVRSNAAAGDQVGAATASDVDAGDTITYSITAGDTNGYFAIGSTGMVTVTAAGVGKLTSGGSYALTVKATDAGGKVDQTTVAVDVTNSDLDPVFAASTYTFDLAENSAANAAIGQVAATDPESAAITYAIASGNDAGLFAINAATGAITLTTAGAAAWNYEGAATTFALTVSATDATENTATSAVTVNITNVNEAPVLTTIADITTAEDTAATGTLTATDVDAGDTKAFAVVTAPTHGILAVDAVSGAYTYTPTANYSGTDTFDVKVTDTAGLVDNQVVNVTVTAANDAPVTKTQEITTGQNIPKTATFDASDPDSDAMTFTVAIQPLNGAVTVTAGEFTFTPTAKFYGIDQFTYTANDGHGGTTNQLVKITVDGTPTVADVAITGAEDAAAINGAFNGSDPESGTLTYTVTETIDPAEGVLTTNADGTFKFVPALNWNGTTEFDYTATDGISTSTAATVTVTVTAVNDPPAAAAAADLKETVTAGNTLTMTLSDYAYDPDGATPALTYSEIPTTLTHGTLKDNGNGTVTYTPTLGQSADDSFSFKAEDADKSSISPTVTIDVVNNAPVATADATKAISGQLTTIDVLANDTDGDTDAAQTLSISSVTQPAKGGVVEINGTKVNFTSTPGYAGDVTFDYTLSDGYGGTDTETVTVTVATQLGGTDGNDYLIGSTATETLSGAAGNDTIDGGSGSDQIDGGSGNDIITFRGTESNITGNTGTDVLVVASTNNAVSALDFSLGSDQCTTASPATIVTGFENLDGSALSQDLTVALDSPSSTSFLFGAGNDTLTAATNHIATMTIMGGAGNDTLTANHTVADYVDGEAGNDTINVGTGNDSVYGSAGNDTISFAGTAATVSGGDGNDTITSTGTGIVKIDGGAGNDTVQVDAASLQAGTTIAGGADTDTLKFAGGSAVTVNAATFSTSSVTGFENLEAANTAGASTFTLTDPLYTSLGVTSLNITDSETAVAIGVDGSALAATNSVTVNIKTDGVTDSLTGGAGNDSFVFYTSAGATALQTADVIDGKTGTDTLQVVLSTNSLTSATLNNVSNIEAITIGNATGVTTALTGTLITNTANFVNITTGVPVNASGMFGDFTFTANDTDSSFSVTGGAGNDSITGGGLNDTLIGGAANDTLKGGDGNDNLQGGDGIDQLTGEAGVDSLSGGAGNDIFNVATANHFIGLAAAETVVGGDGNADVLQFSAGSETVGFADLLGISGIETIKANSATNTFAITLTDAVFSANGATALTLDVGTNTTGAVTVTGSGVGATNSITVDRSTGAGDGGDSVTLGSGNDTLKIIDADLPDANTYTGGSGTDTLAVYTGGATVTLATTITGFEAMTFGTAAGNYDITTAEANVAATSTFTVDGNNLTGTLKFTGTAETDGGKFSITGGAGADTLLGGSGADTISGGAADDVITGGAGIDSLVGGAGNDTFDVITAGTQFTGLSAAETVVGGDGNADTLRFSVGGETVAATDLLGISGIEVINANSATNTFSLTLNDAVFTANGAAAMTVNTVTNTTGNVTIAAGGLSAANSVTWNNQSNGVDTAGNSVVFGSGNDTAQLVDDNLDDVSTITGGSGNDTLQLYTGGNGATTLNTNITGFEAMTFGTAGGVFNVLTVDANVATGTTFTVNGSNLTAILTFNGSAETNGVFSITGGTADDVFTGGSGADTIDGGVGNDSLVGGSGIDSLTGGAGNDTIDGGTGVDVIVGGAGNDTIYLDEATEATDAGSDSADTLYVNFTGVGGGLIVNLTSTTDQITTWDGGANSAIQLGFEHLNASNWNGGTGVDVTAVAAGSVLVGSAKADVFRLGTAAAVDTITYGATGSIVGIAQDSIYNFATASDIIGFTAITLLGADATALAAGTNCQQSAGGLLTFAGTDDTLAEMITTVQADTQLDVAASTAIFVFGSDTYVYNAGAATGNADDQIVKLVGVSGASFDVITVTGATMTIG